MSTVQEPQQQATRTIAGCDCSGPCFYCAAELAAHHHDHFPIPWRHGGREVVAACVRCHRLKEASAPHHWPPSAVQAAATGFGPFAALYVSMAIARITGDGDPTVGRDLALQAVEDCTTPEARLAVAMVTSSALDEASRRCGAMS